MDRFPAYGEVKDEHRSSWGLALINPATIKAAQVSYQWVKTQVSR